MEQINHLDESSKPLDDQLSWQARVERFDPQRVIKMIEELDAQYDPNGDTSEWELLKKLLDEDRLSARKLFPDG
jgi:hypothetical protein